MKQLIFMVVLLLGGSLGSLYHPFWGVLLYYTFAVLRPQYLWEWALPHGVRWSLFAAAAILLGCLLNFGKLMERRRINAVMVLIMLYAVCLILSILTAYSPSVAMTWGIEYGKIMLISLIASVVISHLWQIRVMTLMILIVLGYIAWEINYLYVFDGRLDIFHRGYGGLDNNGAGLMLGMGMPLAYAFGVAAKARWQRLLSWFLGLLMLHGMLMSYSRGAMLAVTVGFIWILLNHRPRRQMLVIAIVVCLAVSALAGKEIRARYQSMSNYEQDGSAQSRRESWAAGWEMAKQHPLTGQGIRNSSIYSQNFGADRLGRTIHSQYIQIAADTGIPAMLIYMGILGTAFFYLRRTRRLCSRYLEDGDTKSSPDDQDPMAREFVAIALGYETSLLIFAFGGVFLSLEVFELPWLMIILAGVMPEATERYLDRLAPGRTQQQFNSPLRTPPTKRKRRKRKPAVQPISDVSPGLTYL